MRTLKVGTCEIKPLEPEALLLAWHILFTTLKPPHPIAAKRWNEKYGKGFIGVDLSCLDHYEELKISDISSLLYRFLKEGLVDGLYIIECQRGPQGREKNYEDYISRDKLPNRIDFLVEYPFIPTTETGDKCDWEFIMKPDSAIIKNFIDEYLNEWKDDQFKLPYANPDKVEKQISKVLEHIFLILSSHSDKEVLIDKINDEGVDFVAVMLFLERLGFIQIIDFCFTSKMSGKMAFRINFLKDFRKNIKEGPMFISEFDFEKLKKIKFKKRETPISQIPPKSSRIKLSLDPKNRALQINNGKIDLSQSESQYELVKIVFQEKPIEEDLGFMEIAFELDNSVETRTKPEKKAIIKKYYHAAYQINKKSSSKTNIQIFKTSSKTLRFNPDYKFEFTTPTKAKTGG